MKLTKNLLIAALFCMGIFAACENVETADEQTTRTTKLSDDTTATDDTMPTDTTSYEEY